MSIKSAAVFFCLILSYAIFLPCMSAMADNAYYPGFLTDSGTQITCMVPGDTDADDDGIPDMDEDANHNGVLDMDETDPCSADTDMDGVQDGTELGLTLAEIGPDTDRAVFVPDQDPDSVTDPLSLDTDHDGLTDGEEDTNFNGRLDGLEGEHDPNFSDSYLYDGFTADFLDPEKWDRTDKVREIRNGHLFSSIAGKTQPEGFVLNQTIFRHADTINAIAADITYLGGEIKNENTFMTGAQIEGVFYSDGNGDVWASINVGGRGNGPEAWWGVMTGGGQWNSGSIPVEIETGSEYDVKIAYDADANQFTFSVNGTEVLFTASERIGQETNPFKALTTGVWGDGDRGVGTCAALFDNVRINNSSDIYENFEDVLINPERWRNQESVRSVANGLLHLQRRATKDKIRLIKFIDHDSKYIRARVTVGNDSELDQVAGLIGVGAVLYNDTYDDGNQYNIGDISASIYIISEPSHTLRAKAYLKRIENVNPLQFDQFYSEFFPTPLEFDTSNTLSVELKGNTVFFKCNGEIIQHEIQGPIYPPHFPIKGINYGLLSMGEEGFMKATVDSFATVHEVSMPYDFDYGDDNDIDGRDLAEAAANAGVMTTNMLRYLSSIFGTVADD